ncbi:MAG: YbjN domain-containing protein [Pseudomonadota bacterium]
MSIDLLERPAHADDPLDSLETVAGLLELESERVDDAELHLAMPGAWRDAGVWFTWRPEVSTIQMGAPLDIKVPETRVNDAARLVAMVNERLWIGHFDLWSEDLTIVYRNAIILPHESVLDAAQAQAVIRATSEAIDRFFPAFNYLVWGGKTPEEALEASLFDTVGSA